MGGGISRAECRDKFPYTKKTCRKLYECPDWTQEECSKKYPTTSTGTEWTETQCKDAYPCEECGEETCSTLQNDYDNLQIDYNSLQSENDANIAELTRLNQKVQDLTAQAISEQKCKTAYPCAVSQADYNSLQSENDANIAELTRLNQKVRDLTAQAISEQKCKTAYPCAVSQADYNSLQSENDANIAEITRLNQKVRDLTEQANWSEQKCETTYPCRTRVCDDTSVMPIDGDTGVIVLNPPEPTAVRTTPPIGYAQGVCKSGFYDKTKGKANFWGCGKDCVGGAYWTDGGCNCACIANARDPF